MIEQEGRVVAVERGAVWVQTRRQSTCGSCAIKAGCGQGLMDQLGVRAGQGLVKARCDLQLKVGDEVVIGIGETQLLKAACMVYVLPLVSFFLWAGTAQQAAWSEQWIILSGLFGLALAFGLIRFWDKRQAQTLTQHPVVLRANLAARPIL